MSKTKAVKTISLLWLGSVLGAGCAFLTQVLLARNLGPETFGVLSSALAMVVLVGPLASFGVGGFWLKAFGQEGWLAARWLRASLQYTALSTVLVLAALLAWALLGPHDATTRHLLSVLSIYLLGQVAVELVSAKLQLEERYLALALWQFVPHLLRLLLVAILAFVLVKWMTLYNIAYAYALVSVALFGLGVVFIWRMFRGQLALKGHVRVDGSAGQSASTVGLKQVAAQSWPFGLAGVFYLIYFQSDIILLKYIVGDEAAGIYNVAFVIMAAIYILPGVIYLKFLLPKLHRWANHDREKFRHVYRAGNWAMLALGILAMSAIWLLASWGVNLLFGERYMDAVLALNILAFTVPVYFVSASVGSILMTKEHIKRKVVYMGMTATANIILNGILIPLYGFPGAAVATVLSNTLLLILYFYSVHKYVFNVTD